MLWSTKTSDTSRRNNLKIVIEDDIIMMQYIVIRKEKRTLHNYTKSMDDYRRL